MYKLIVPLVLCSILFSCNDDNGNELEPDYLIFGHFYGMCGGEECVEIFKLTDNKLFEDSKDEYPSYEGNSTFNFNNLSKEKFEKANGLFNAFPSALLDEESKVFGCPDCHDQGGMYIEYKKGNLRKHWTIDNDKTNVPEYLHPFINEVTSVIAEINEK